MHPQARGERIGLVAVKTFRERPAVFLSEGSPSVSVGERDADQSADAIGEAGCCQPEEALPAP
jgi:hypothetical protein